MRHDFDTPIPRRGTASFKWDRYGPDVLPLWVADMDFAAPPAVVAALRARADHGVYGYALVPDSLVAAVVGHLADAYGWTVEPGWLVWLPGVVPGLALAALAFAAPGEAVLTVLPAYPPFLEVPRDHGRRVVGVPARRREGRWWLPLEELEAAARDPGVKVVYFCHPHNPLGRVWRRDEVAALADLCRRRDLVLVSDEIHCDLVLDDLRHEPTLTVAPDLAERTVTLMAPSKTFNLPGLNFAFAVVPDAGLRRRFLQPGRHLLPFPGCFAVAAAEAAYRHGGPWLADLLAYLRGNRDRVEAWAAGRAGVVTTHVEATYLAWLDVAGCGLADPFAACLAAGVALSPGSDFGDPAGLRLNFACPRATLDEGLHRLERVFA